MKRFFWVLFVMSLWGHLLMAQEKAVSGIVVSTEDGLPMIGVAVVDKQTMNGVTTNEMLNKLNSVVKLGVEVVCINV